MGWGSSIGCQDLLLLLPLLTLPLLRWSIPLLISWLEKREVPIPLAPLPGFAQRRRFFSPAEGASRPTEGREGEKAANALPERSGREGRA